MMSDVVIACSRRDVERAEEVCRALEAAGVRCWLAHRDIGRRGNYLDAGFEAVDRAQAILLIFTANTNSADISLLDHAADRGVPAIWLLLDQSAPSGELARLKQFAITIHAFPGPLESYLSHLTDCVKPFCLKSAPILWHVALRRYMPQPRPKHSTVRNAALIFAALVVLAFTGGVFFSEQVVGLTSAVVEYFQNLILA
jgi:hypothetical protein